MFAILPTGFGKSLCYVCLPSAYDALLQKEPGHSIVIVVTPLLAILEDQVLIKLKKATYECYMLWLCSHRCFKAPLSL